MWLGVAVYGSARHGRARILRTGRGVVWLGVSRSGKARRGMILAEIVGVLVGMVVVIVSLVIAVWSFI